jgi:hypothetical protein
MRYVKVAHHAGCDQNSIFHFERCRRDILKVQPVGAVGAAPGVLFRWAMGDSILQINYLHSTVRKKPIKVFYLPLREVKIFIHAFFNLSLLQKIKLLDAWRPLVCCHIQCNVFAAMTLIWF